MLPRSALTRPRALAPSGGLLRFGLSENGYVSPVWGGYPGGLYLDREAGLPERRLDAGRYTHLSMHAYASEAASAGLNWWACEGLDPSCQGGQPFLLRKGWNTYDITLRNGGFGLPQEWTGRMTGLRLAASPGVPIDVEIDWMRAYAPTTTATAPQNAVWDVDDNTADNTSGRPGWGIVRRGGAQVCDLSYLPAGRYRITEGGTTRGPVVLRRPARPVVLDPDLVGGVDFSADDPWDFSAPSDVAASGNVTGLTVGDRLEGTNDGPTINDPHVWLNTHGRLIDTERFHRATVRSGYDGIFRLEDEPGGGTMGRIVWHHQHFSGVQQTEDVVTYGGTKTVTVDLADPAAHETDNDPEFDIPWSTLEADGSAGTRTRTAVRAAGGSSASPCAPTTRPARPTGCAGTTPATRPGRPCRCTATATLRASTASRSRPPCSSGRAPTPTTGTPPTSRSARTGSTRWCSRRPASGRPTRPARSTCSARCSRVRRRARSCRLPATSSTPAPPRRAGSVPDVPATSPHRASIDCLAWWQVTQPTAAGYPLTEQVTRGQMAGFLRRVVESTGQRLSAGGSAFADDDSSTHAAAIDALAAAGVVTGYGDGLYRPDEPVTRAQMATFLVRTAELRLGNTLTAAADYFTDDDTSAHRASIDEAAAAGVTGGTAEGRYSPAALVRRDAMASFLVRLIDLLVASGKGAAPTR